MSWRCNSRTAIPKPMSDQNQIPPCGPSRNTSKHEFTRKAVQQLRIQRFSRAHWSALRPAGRGDTRAASRQAKGGLEASTRRPCLALPCARAPSSWSCADFGEEPCRLGRYLEAIVVSQTDSEALARPEILAVDRVVDDLRPPLEAPLAGVREIAAGLLPVMLMMFSTTCRGDQRPDLGVGRQLRPFSSRPTSTTTTPPTNTGQPGITGQAAPDRSWLQDSQQPECRETATKPATIQRRDDHERRDPYAPEQPAPAGVRSCPARTIRGRGQGGGTRRFQRDARQVTRLIRRTTACSFPEPQLADRTAPQERSTIGSHATKPPPTNGCTAQNSGKGIGLESRRPRR